MIDSIIFDFDGTLADTNQLVKNSFKHVCKIYNKEYDEDYILTTFGEPLKSVLARDFREYDVDEVMTAYRNYQLERFEDDVRLYDTVLETILHLVEGGKKLGIVTSRLKDSTLEALKKFDILRYFDTVITIDDVKNPKPHGEPILKGVEELNGRADKTVYVGDSAIDMLCAKNAGVVPILVGWHDHSLKIAEDNDVKYVLGKMWELIDVLNHL